MVCISFMFRKRKKKKETLIVNAALAVPLLSFAKPPNFIKGGLNRVPICHSLSRLYYRIVGFKNLVDRFCLFYLFQKFNFNSFRSTSHSYPRSERITTLKRFAFILATAIFNPEI